MQNVLYRPEADMTSEGEPSETGADSGASEEIGDARGDERPRVFEPVSFTQEEKDFMRRLAPFAGDTPRQALRFVNVYGLVKSVIEESEDEAVQTIDRFALMAQLAIATGSQEAAPLYFRAVIGGSAMISEIIEPTMPTHATSGPDRNRIRNILLAYADKHDVPVMDLVGKLADDNASTRKDIVDAYINDTGLLEKLRAAAPIARRYTFAA